MSQELGNLPSLKVRWFSDKATSFVTHLLAESFEGFRATNLQKHFAFLLQTYDLCPPRIQINMMNK